MAIVVASDLSRRSLIAISRGAQLAKDLGLPLHIVHIVDADLPPSARAALVQGAADILRRACEAHGVEPAVEVIGGNAHTAVSRYALDVGAGLIVVGAHDEAKGGFFHFNETTAARIARSCPLPVLLARTEPAGPYRQAVIGIDFSIFALAAIRQVRRLAPQTVLHLIHAYQVPFRTRLGTEEFLAEIKAGARQEFNRFLEEDMAQLVRQAGLPNTGASMLRNEVVEGTPYLVLTQAVEKLGADLLAVGTHGSGSVAQMIWGSVATALLENPPCDLLVVHEV